MRAVGEFVYATWLSRNRPLTRAQKWESSSVANVEWLTAYFHFDRNKTWLETQKKIVSSYSASIFARGHLVNLALKFTCLIKVVFFFVIFEVTCGYLWSLELTCGHLWLLEVTYGNLLLLENWDHFWSHEVTCGHMRSLVVTWGRLW